MILPVSGHGRRGMSRWLAALFALLAVLALLVSTLPATAVSSRGFSSDTTSRGPQKFRSGSYIVQLAENPVVAYAGGIPGYKATQPARGQKINPNGTDVVRYASYLDSRHNSVLAAVGNGRKLYSYRYSFNGFAAELTGSQAAKLAAMPGVISVSPNEIRQIDTSSTPGFLGLNAPGGLWDRLGGVGSAGEGVIIGIIDTGIWPESLSFSDRTGLNGNASKDGKLDYQQIPGWHGRCVPGEAFNASDCNQKLIGAQYFNAGFGGNAGVDATIPWEYNSPRDFGGHGTHTASTSGGNANVPTTGPAAVFGSISGIAPRARIAAYKVCWESEGGGGCSMIDSLAAIDQAVADGVDVINYSISGTLTNFADPVEIAFLFAARAGVFVAASAGNSGPTSSTVAHPGPWLTTVAAGTHSRNGNGSVTLGNGATYAGASVANAIGPVGLVDSVNAGVAGVNPAEAELCFPGSLDSARVAGKIVICKRGVIARTDKSQAVQMAGGVGMIMYNSPDSSLNADFHFVPTVHINQANGMAIKAYAATAGATAQIGQATIVNNDPAPFTATFSSRGPLRAGGGDVLKPDVIAPGQDILAAVAPPGNSGRDFDLYSGTSMSSPHVAGLAALLKDLHPTWSPMMIKSALMTSAYDVLDGPNTHPLVIFRQGAGHVRPNSAADPGLVYNAGWNNWLAFLCGSSNFIGADTCNVLASRGYSFDPSNLNAASIAIGDMAGAQTVKRTVTNVGAKETYTFSAIGLSGIQVTPSIGSFTVNPGESKNFTISFTNAGAALNTYTAGYVIWTGDKGHVVRIPVVIRPVAMAAPAQVSGSYNLTFGYNGAFSATPRGLVPATTFAGTVAQDPDATFDPADATGTQAYTVNIPAGTTYARFSLFDEYTDGTDDLDLYVYNSSGTLVASSGGGTSAEEANLLNPPAGTYTVYVHGWGTDGPDTNFTLFTWVLGSTSAGNMTVSAPANAVANTTGTIGLSFNGLTPGVKYLGSIAYSGATGMPNPTIVRVDP